MISGRGASFSRLLSIACVLGAMAVGVPSAFCQLSVTAPTYSSQSIVHAATQTAQALAPNTIATIYGSNLAFDTVNATTNQLVGGSLPQVLAGVSVIVNGWIANLFYVSPTQINFLIPYQLTAGTVNVLVARQGVAGPEAPIQLNATAPGLFVYNNLALATHLNGTLLTTASPATPGEIVVLYVVGLGRVTPDTTSGKIVTSAASIAAASQMQVLLNGTPCPAANILYAGLAPGFAGLYQINLVIPPLTPLNPEIRISIGPQISPPAVMLAAQ
jgi:uncharacterized protein (TIGR03437 family)